MSYMLLLLFFDYLGRDTGHQFEYLVFKKEEEDEIGDTAEGREVQFSDHMTHRLCMGKKLTCKHQVKGLLLNYVLDLPADILKVQLLW